MQGTLVEGRQVSGSPLIELCERRDCESHDTAASRAKLVRCECLNEICGIMLYKRAAMCS